VKLVWDESAWADYVWWQAQDRKILKRIGLALAACRGGDHCRAIFSVGWVPKTLSRPTTWFLVPVGGRAGELGILLVARRSGDLRGLPAGARSYMPEVHRPGSEHAEGPSTSLYAA
jgi:hypothetical protein